MFEVEQSEVVQLKVVQSYSLSGLHRLSKIVSGCTRAPGQNHTGSSLFRVCNHHKNQYGLELKFILPTDNDEEPKSLSLSPTIC